MKQRDALISQIYFWNRTPHVSDSFSVHHQESSTVHTATGICHTGYADCLQATYCCDDGQRNCLKHVEFYPKNKSEKLVHLVDFIIRIVQLCLCVIIHKARFIISVLRM